MSAPALQRYLDFLEEHLPRNLWLQAAIVLGLAALPFAPVHLVARPLAFLTVFISSLALVYILIRAFLIRDRAQFVLDARRLGIEQVKLAEFEEIDTKPVKAIGRLLLTVLFLGCAIVLSFSSITYSYINQFGADGPFGVRPSIGEVLMYFVDHALKGMVFDFFEVFELSVQDRLRINPQADVQFAFMLVGYRLIMALLTLQILWMAFRYYFEKEDPRLVETKWRQSPQYQDYQRLLRQEGEDAGEYDDNGQYDDPEDPYGDGRH